MNYSRQLTVWCEFSASSPAPPLPRGLTPLHTTLGSRPEPDPPASLPSSQRRSTRAAFSSRPQLGAAAAGVLPVREHLVHVRQFSARMTALRRFKLPRQRFLVPSPASSALGLAMLRKAAGEADRSSPLSPFRRRPPSVAAGIPPSPRRATRRLCGESLPISRLCRTFSPSAHNPLIQMKMVDGC